MLISPAVAGPKITTAEVRRIAELAHLELDESETKLLAHELGSILEYVEQLGRLDTDGVEPTAHVLDLINAFRPDESRTSLLQDEALSGAPESEAGHFKVPPVI